jgi:Pregnancy-associated plasma protein-A
MNSAYFIIFSLICRSVFLHCAQGYLQSDHQHHNHTHNNDNKEHDHDEHMHHDHHHSENHRTLRETASFMIGNRRYANQKAFVKYMANINGRRDQAVTVEVPTYFHVITSNSKGDIDDDTLQAQLDVMNDAYRVHGFSFRLMQTTRTENSAWYTAGLSSPEQDEMKAALRVGDASTLNVYFSAAGGGRILGYTTFPSDYAASPKDDGVVILNASVPGGSATNYNDGKTLVHEAGHWFGLYHTFQTAGGFFPFLGSFLSLFGLRSGCKTDADEVDDTPAQRTQTFGCPARKDSCPGVAGLDPINNYMDYSDDSCLIEFTPGQSDRMAAMWNEYRA